MNLAVAITFGHLYCIVSCVEMYRIKVKKRTHWLDHVSLYYLPVEAGSEYCRTILRFKSSSKLVGLAWGRGCEVSFMKNEAEGRVGGTRGTLLNPVHCFVHVSALHPAPFLTFPVFHVSLNNSPSGKLGASDSSSTDQDTARAQKLTFWGIGLGISPCSKLSQKKLFI